MAHALPVAMHRRPARVAAAAAALVGALAIAALAAGAADPVGIGALAGDLAVATAFVAFGVALWSNGQKGDLSGPLMVGHRGDVVARRSRRRRSRSCTAGRSCSCSSLRRPGARGRGWSGSSSSRRTSTRLVAERRPRPRFTVALGVAVAGLAVGRWAFARGLPAAGARRSVGRRGGDRARARARRRRGPGAGEAVLWCYEAILVSSAVALWADRRWGRSAGAAMTTVVIDLGAAVRGGSLGGGTGRRARRSVARGGLPRGRWLHRRARPAARTPGARVGPCGDGRRRGRRDRLDRARPGDAARAGACGLDRSGGPARARQRAPRGRDPRASWTTLRPRARGWWPRATRSGAASRPGCTCTSAAGLTPRRTCSPGSRAVPSRSLRRCPASWSAHARSCTGSPPGFIRAAWTQAGCDVALAALAAAHRCRSRSASTADGSRRASRRPRGSSAPRRSRTSSSTRRRAGLRSASNGRRRGCGERERRRLRRRGCRGRTRVCAGSRRGRGAAGAAWRSASAPAAALACARGCRRRRSVTHGRLARAESGAVAVVAVALSVLAAAATARRAPGFALAGRFDRAARARRHGRVGRGRRRHRAAQRRLAPRRPASGRSRVRVARRRAGIARRPARAALHLGSGHGRRRARAARPRAAGRRRRPAHGERGRGRALHRSGRHARRASRAALRPCGRAAAARVRRICSSSPTRPRTAAALSRWGLRLGLLAIRRASCWRCGSSRARRARAGARAPLIAPGCAYLALAAAGLAHAWRRGVVGGDPRDQTLWSAQAAALLGVAAGVALLRAAAATAARPARATGRRSRRTRPSPARLRDALAALLGDPQLELLHATADGWIDADGNTRTPPPDATATPLVRDGEPVALLCHRPGLLDDPRTVAEIERSVRLGLDHERLQAQLRRQLAHAAPLARRRQRRQRGRTAAARTRPARRRPATARRLHLRRRAGPSPRRRLHSTRESSAHDTRSNTPSTSCGRSPTGSTRSRSPRRGSPPRSRASATAAPPSPRPACRADGSLRRSRRPPTSRSPPSPNGGHRTPSRSSRPATHRRLTLDVSAPTRPPDDLIAIDDRLAAVDGTLTINALAPELTRVRIELPCA